VYRAELNYHFLAFSIAAAILQAGLNFSASPQPENDLTLLMMRFR